jgi:hypothetical protein
VKKSVYVKEDDPAVGNTEKMITGQFRQGVSVCGRFYVIMNNEDLDRHVEGVMNL